MKDNLVPVGKVSIIIVTNFEKFCDNIFDNFENLAPVIINLN